MQSTTSGIMISLVCGIVLCLVSTVAAQDCNPRKCPNLPCSEPVRLPGFCCPVCPCSYRGVYYAVGDIVFTRNRCITCECTKWGIECMPWPCPRLPCTNPIKRAGECCPECGCMSGGIFYEMGYQVTRDNPCEDCRCGVDGRVACTNLDCEKPKCDRPYSIPGVCCKKCGCRDRDGQEYDYGPLPVTDKCSPQCTCNENGTITCDKPACPVLNCTKRLQYTPKGECCTVCGCMEKGIQYYQGDLMPIPPREKCAVSCSCDVGGVETCTNQTCPEVACRNPILAPGECCPKCGCLDKKKKLREFGIINFDPCAMCTCNLDGGITCGEPTTCPRLKCVSGYYKPNATEEEVCCPKCKCKFGKETYRPGEIFQGPKCQRCECHQFTGRVSCESADCSHVKLQCGNPIIEKGECCPSCPDGPSCTYKKNAIAFGTYRTFGNLVCTCLGDPWFPNAFCAPKTPSPEMKKTFDKRWQKYGYPVEKKEKKSKKV